MLFRASCALFWQESSRMTRSVIIVTFVKNRHFCRKPLEAQNLRAIKVRFRTFLTLSHRYSWIFLLIPCGTRRQEPRNDQDRQEWQESVFLLESSRIAKKVKNRQECQNTTLNA